MFDDDRRCSHVVRRDTRLRAVIPFFSRADVERAVSPQEAYEAVPAGFVAHARGEWTMQPKLYVTNYPAGDFRAMPALGGGHALLKWVTSFPGNPALGLPTVTGSCRLNDAETGELVGGARRRRGDRTAHRGGSGARGRDARPRRRSVAVVGCGVNGAAAARTFAALGRDSRCGTSTRRAPRRSQTRVGARVARRAMRRSPLTSSSRSHRAGRSSSRPARCDRASTSR